MISKIRQYLGRYIAAESTTRRRDPGARVQSSDNILTASGRDRMTEGARELWRNYSVASWAIRKHLDFVSSFTFSSNNGDAKFDRKLEALVENWSRPVNFDIARRHSLRAAMRLFEARRVIDGDVFAVKLNDGRLQPIEGHRVKDPGRSMDGENWVHGVLVAKGGGMRSVAVHSVDRYGRYVFERTVPAKNVLHLGYFDSFDQVRGVSPLSGAIVQFQDVLEVQDYARAKAKITQLFALAITREGSDWDDDEESGGEYTVDFGKGPVKLELDPGDKAEFLESKHPSTEFQAFMQGTLQAALKSLDIPWSFYSEDFTNFFGSKAALQNYLQSCKAKREDLKEFLNRLLVWKINSWIAQGLLTIPTESIAELRWDWIPAGMPWWDTAKEVKGDLDAINGRLRTRTEIRRERFGDDWRNVVRKLKEEEDYLKELGLSVATSPGTPQPDNVDDDNNTEDEDDNTTKQG